MYCLKEKIPCGDPWNLDIQPVAYLNTMPLFRIQYDGRTNQNVHDPATVRKEPIPGRSNLFINVVAVHILPQGQQPK
jgi:hypothetical protein